jgi:general stress protein 26
MKQTESEKFHELLKGFDTAVLVTHAGDGRLRARPMVVAQIDDNCDLWFITDEHSAKVHEIANDTRVHVIGQKGRDSCASISGRAFLVHDRARVRELWKTAYRVWFPQGVDDPSIVLVRVAGEEAEYWDNTGIKRFSYLYRAVKAVLTQTKPEVEEGRQHGHVRLE